MSTTGAGSTVDSIDDFLPEAPKQKGLGSRVVDATKDTVGDYLVAGAKGVTGTADFLSRAVTFKNPFKSSDWKKKFDKKADSHYSGNDATKFVRMLGEYTAPGLGVVKAVNKTGTVVNKTKDVIKKSKELLNNKTSREIYKDGKRYTESLRDGKSITNKGNNISKEGKIRAKDRANRIEDIKNPDVKQGALTQAERANNPTIGEVLAKRGTTIEKELAKEGITDPTRLSKITAWLKANPKKSILAAVTVTGGTTGVILDNKREAEKDAKLRKEYEQGKQPAIDDLLPNGREEPKDKGLTQVQLNKIQKNVLQMIQKKPSIVDYLNDKGLDSSYEYRSKLAANMGIEDFQGTAEQNLGMLERLMQQEAIENIK